EHALMAAVFFQKRYLDIIQNYTSLQQVKWGVPLFYCAMVEDLREGFGLDEKETDLLYSRGAEISDKISELYKRMRADNVSADISVLKERLLPAVAVLYAINPEVSSQLLDRYVGQRGYLPMIEDVFALFAFMSPEETGILRKFYKEYGKPYVLSGAGFNPAEFLIVLVGYLRAYNEYGLNVKDFEHNLFLDASSPGKIEQNLGFKIVELLAEKLNINIKRERLSISARKILKEFDMRYFGLLVSARAEWCEEYAGLFKLLLQSYLEGNSEGILNPLAYKNYPLSDYGRENEEAVRRIRRHNLNVLKTIVELGLNLSVWLDPNKAVPTSEITAYKSGKAIKSDAIRFFRVKLDGFRLWLEEDPERGNWEQIKKTLGRWAFIDNDNPNLNLFFNLDNLNKLKRFLEKIERENFGNVPSPVADLSGAIAGLHDAEKREEWMPANKIWFWKRQVGIDIFAGNYANSCTALNKDASATLEFIMDQGTQYIYIGDPDKLEGIKGYLRFFLALNKKGEPSIFVDSIDGTEARSHKDEMMAHLTRFAERLGIAKENVLEYSGEISKKVGGVLTTAYRHHSGIVMWHENPDYSIEDWSPEDAQGELHGDIVPAEKQDAPSPAAAADKESCSTPHERGRAPLGSADSARKDPYEASLLEWAEKEAARIEKSIISRTLKILHIRDPIKAAAERAALEIVFCMEPDTKTHCIEALRRISDADSGATPVLEPSRELIRLLYAFVQAYEIAVSSARPRRDFGVRLAVSMAMARFPRWLISSQGAASLAGDESTRIGDFWHIISKVIPDLLELSKKSIGRFDPARHLSESELKGQITPLAIRISEILMRKQGLGPSRLVPLVVSPREVMKMSPAEQRDAVKMLTGLRTAVREIMPAIESMPQKLRDRFNAEMSGKAGEEAELPDEPAAYKEEDDLFELVQDVSEGNPNVIRTRYRELERQFKELSFLYKQYEEEEKRPDNADYALPLISEKIRKDIIRTGETMEWLCDKFPWLGLDNGGIAIRSETEGRVRKEDGQEGGGGVLGGMELVYLQHTDFPWIVKVLGRIFPPVFMCIEMPGKWIFSIIKIVLLKPVDKGGLPILQASKEREPEFWHYTYDENGKLLKEPCGFPGRWVLEYRAKKKDDTGLAISRMLKSFALSAEKIGRNDLMKVKFTVEEKLPCDNISPVAKGDSFFVTPSNRYGYEIIVEEAFLYCGIARQRKAFLDVLPALPVARPDIARIPEGKKLLVPGK
ncbi:MAG: hypothetical protein JW994_04505, partial [Candidatus Omnitrophica bacterium]|nr:hypothetical protein [Candidatus Omnitrophota bacterium]